MIQGHLHDTQPLSWFATKKVTAKRYVAADSLGVWASIVLLAMSLPVPAARAQGYMFGRASFGVGSTGAGPASVAVGDFNGDGMLDLGVVQPSRNSVAILLGKVDGTLVPATYYRTGNQPAAVAVGDFNGDGRLDLAVGNQNCGSTYYCGASGSVSILLGKGDGTFRTQIVNASGTQPGALVGADFNGDGNPDLVVSNLPKNSMMVFLGNGDGTLQPGAQYTMSSAAAWLATGDLNGDNYLDLAVATSNGPVAIFLGKGDGTFERTGDVLVLPEPNCVALGDLSGDGIPDLAVTYAGENAVSVLVGRGDGSFQPRSDYPTGTYPAALALVDLNGDGHLDVAVANGFSQTSSILLGKGDGSFESARDYLLPGTPTALGVGDFNRDGKPDLAVVMSGLGVVSVILGRGDGTIPNPVPLGSAQGSWAIATADFNGDEKLDLVTTNLGDNSISLFLGDGTGSFVLGSLAYTPAVPVAAVTGDFNRDGTLDLAVVSQICTSLPCSPGLLSVFLGLGDGTLAPRTDYNSGSIPIALTAGDLNGDGVTDLVVVNNGFGFANTVSLFIGRGDGTFLDGGTLVTGNGPSQAVAADFNGDGFTDLAVAYTGGISIFPGRGAGTFGPRTDYVLSSPAKAIAAADFNQDGKLDLAVTTGNSVMVIMGKGDGTFLAGSTYPIASFTTLQYLLVGDFNGDGKQDLLVGKSNNAVAILAGRGDGTFLAAVDVAAGKSERGWVAGDFDGDGGLDFAAASVGSNSIYMVLNTAAMALYPAGIDFGVTGVGDASSPRLVSISNPSGAPLQITAVTASGAFTVASSCPSTIAPGASCTLSVAASPTGSGDSTGVLTITDNAPGSPQYVPLHGIGVQVPQVSASPVALNFGPQNLGSASAAMSVTLKNSGTAVLNIAGISANGDFVAADTCLPSLSSGAECTITVTFTPSAAGARTGILTITDNAASSPQTVGLTGAGMAKAVVALSVTNLAFGNQRVNTTSSAESVTLRNSGNAPLNITSIDATSGFTASSTCPAALAAGTTCVISVSFAPTATGSVVGTLSLTDDADGGSQTVTLTGAGTAPQATLSASSLTFAGQTLGKASSSQTVTLSNPGTAPLTISSVTIGGAASGDFALQSSCGPLLDPAAFCTMSVTFTPTAMGPRNATLSLATNAVGSPSSVTLTGTGTAPQALLSASILTFAGQMLGKVSVAQTVTLVNPGTATLTISSVTVGGAASGDFALQNSCGGSLNPAASCTMSVTFTPTAVGPRNATLSMATNAVGSPSSVTLIGTGTAPEASLSVSSLSFSGQMLGKASSAQSVTLSNLGTAVLTISNVTVGGSASGDFALQNSCGGSLNPAASCTMSVTFTPTVVGPRNATLSMATNAAVSPSSVTLTGTGIAPQAALSASSLSFSGQMLGKASSAQSVTLSNLGTAVLTISNVTVGGSASGDFGLQNSCGGSLDPGANCAMIVTFTPTAVGPRNASLIVSTNAADSPSSVTLTGTGTAPQAALSASILSFAGQMLGKSSSAQTATLSNPGTASLTISSATIAGSASGDFALQNSCGGSLDPAASCSVSVTFTPSAVGPRNATLSMATNAVGSPSSVTLTGTGTAPQASLSVSALTFAGQMLGKVSVAQRVTLANPGTAVLTISNVTVGGAASGDFVLQNPCGPLLDPAASCTISVTFTPSAVGPRNATLSMATNAVGSPSSVTLTGTGTAPQASLSALSLSFSGQMLGKASSAHSVTLSNPGTAALTISGVAIGGFASGDFALQNPCGPSLDPAASCAMSVTFTPTAVGRRDAILSVTTNAADSASSVTLTATGIAPHASLAPSSLSFTAQMLGNASSTQSVTLSNPGTAPLTISSMTIGGAASGDFTLQNQCGGSLDPGAACMIGVSFTPVAVGTRNAVLSVTTNSAGSQPSVTLSGAGADFSLIASTGVGNTLTVAPGQSALFQTTLMPGGMRGTVSLTCTGAPSNATCQVSPGGVSLDGVSSVNLSISVATTAPSIVVFRTPPAPWTPGIYLAGMVMLMGLGLMAYLTGGGFERRTGWGLATLMLAAAVSLGCGGGGQSVTAPRSSQPGTPAGTYTLTVTASTQAISHTLSFTLTVKN